MNGLVPRAASGRSEPDDPLEFGHWEAMGGTAELQPESSSSGPFSHPVYSKLSRINGSINKMKEAELIAKLKSLRLDSRGSVCILRKRLKAFYKQQKLVQVALPESHQQYDFLCVIDFEATCEAKQGPDFPHEIIEFPAVLVDTRTKKIVDEFHEYCCPVQNRQLSEFCTSLTGITQECVDRADIFPKVLQHFHEWINLHRLGNGNSFAIVTDGPWDMGKFLVVQCQLSGIPLPAFAKKWVNVRKAFSNFYGTKRMSLVAMLELLGWEFKGQQHSGIDDARNIARIAIRMMKDGAVLRVNEKINRNGLTKKDDQNVGSPGWVSVTEKEAAHDEDGGAGNRGRGRRGGQGKAADIEDIVDYIERLGIDPSTVGDERSLLRHRSDI